MSRRLDRPVTVCTLAVSLAAFGAAVLPATARAGGVSEEPPTTLAALTDAVSETTAMVAPEAEGVQDSLEAATAPVTPSDSEAPVPADTTSEAASAPVAPSDSEAPVPADTTSEADTPPAATAEAPGAAPLPAPAEPPTQEPSEASISTQGATSDPVEERDTISEPSDTATDTPASVRSQADEAPTAQKAAPAEPKTPTRAPAEAAKTPARAPANINVSVRIGSPGDNGDVSQLNITTASTPPSAPTGTASAPAPTASPAESSTPSRDAAPQTENPANPPAGAGASDTWYWNWDCLGAEPISTISPTGSGTDQLPSSWTWIWNCGANGSQYQIETPPGYQQGNTNIAIRISSPGNDGAVTQINQINQIVETQVAQVRAQVDQVVQQTTQSVLGSRPSTAGPPLPHVGPTVLPPVISLPPVARVLGDVLGIPAAGTTHVAVGITLPVPPQSLLVPPQSTPAAKSSTPPTATTPTEASAGLEPAPHTRGRHTPARHDTVADLPSAAGFRAHRPANRPTPPVIGEAGTRPDLTATWVAASSDARASAVSGSASRVSPDTSERGTAPRWRPPTRDTHDPAPVSTVTAAAVSGGGASGTGLPFLLALPFVAAMLDLARRVVLERATWPSGHRRRVPDRPG